MGVIALIDVTFWQGKRVFLTGHTGFKGGWLALWLEEMGAEVRGYSLPAPTDPSLFDVANVSRGLFSEEGDIRDFQHLNESIAAFKPEIVFHMAAQPLVRLSYNDPIETYSTNVMGTVHLLEAIKRVGGVKAVVNITSDKCYENREWVWGYRENEAMGGYDPYSNSKGCAELVA
ncbi:MAG: GDP-mannose 4,6-dehydratase, partial [Enterovibrio sp.]